MGDLIDAVVGLGILSFCLYACLLVCVFVVLLVGNIFRWLFGSKPAQPAADPWKQRQRQSYQKVRQQMARGDATFANVAEAQAALKAHGGRPSNLDKRRF